jgi:hypothetical protein
MSSVFFSKTISLAHTYVCTRATLGPLISIIIDTKIFSLQDSPPKNYCKHAPSVHTSFVAIKNLKPLNSQSSTPIQQVQEDHKKIGHVNQGGWQLMYLYQNREKKALTIWNTNSLLLFNGRIQPKSQHNWAQDAKFPMDVVVKTNCTNNKCTQSSIIKVHNQCTSSNLPFKESLINRGNLENGASL